MKLFLDTADPVEAAQAFNAYPYLSGITTTPVMIEGDPIYAYNALLMGPKDTHELHVEAMGDSAGEIHNNAAKLAMELRTTFHWDNIKDRLVFKVPVSQNGLKAVHSLEQAGFKTNVHLIYSPNQAMLAQAAGATYICVCGGKFEDQGYESKWLTRNARSGWGADLMFSSVRYPAHLWLAERWGADVVTIPPKVLYGLLDNDLTERGTTEFRAAYDAML
jgi:transaldolase